MNVFSKLVSGLVLCLPAWIYIAPPTWAVTITAINGNTAIGFLPTAGSQWFAVPGSALYFIRAKASFDNGPFRPFVNSVSTVKLGSTTLATPQIFGPNPGVPFGQGKIVHQGVQAVPLLRIDYNYTISATAKAGTPPPQTRTTTTIAEYVDPTPLVIGDLNTSVDLSQSIKAGTQLQGFQVGQPRFDLIFEGRFADSELDEPLLLWPDDDILPSEAFNLYQIRIFENSIGNIESSVQLFSSPDPDFAITFSSSEQQIKSAIETADWVRNPNGFFLNQELPLVNVSVVNLNQNRSGNSAVIGVKNTLPSFEANTAIPEPSSSLSLLAFGTLGAASTLKRKLKSSKSTEKETTKVS